jgi:hypothetical protein
MRKLFVEELKDVQGGRRPPGGPGNGCGGITTLACCEESPKCDSCCATL